MTTAFHWRPATPGDAAKIARLSTAHLGLYAEGADVFDERIRLAPEGCYVLEADGTVIGYFISHPWTRKSPPALHQMLDVIPTSADCWYVHDVAVDKQARGTGVVSDIFNRIGETAKGRGFPVAMLVAVSGAAHYWRKLGFEDATTEALRCKLRDYGEDAVYMERAL